MEAGHQRIGLKGDGSVNHRNVKQVPNFQRDEHGNLVFSPDLSTKPQCQEKAWYDVDYEVLKKIASAKEVRVKVIGKEFYRESSFTQPNFDNFKKFVELYPPKISPIKPK